MRAWSENGAPREAGRHGQRRKEMGDTVRNLGAESEMGGSVRNGREGILREIEAWEAIEGRSQGTDRDGGPVRDVEAW